jgi:hypothetical protein
MTGTPLVAEKTAYAVNEHLDGLMLRLLMARLERCIDMRRDAKQDANRIHEAQVDAVEAELRAILTEYTNIAYGSAAE